MKGVYVTQSSCNLALVRLRQAKRSGSLGLLKQDILFLGRWYLLDFSVIDDLVN